MSLAAAVETRLGTARLVQLTNPDDKGATTVNAGLLAAAVADVEGEFLKKGITFSDANAAHVSTAVIGVQWRLFDYKSAFSEGARALRDRFREELDQLALVTSRDRVIPEIAEGESAFDELGFSALKPRPPRAREYRRPLRPGDW